MTDTTNNRPWTLERAVSWVDHENNELHTGWMPIGTYHTSTEARAVQRGFFETGETRITLSDVSRFDAETSRKDSGDANNGQSANWFQDIMAGAR